MRKKISENLMRKEAIKKYIEDMGFAGMLLHYLCRLLTKAEMQIVGRIAKRFGKTKKDRIVFKNREMMDYTDNPRALFEYLVAQGYHEKYQIIWMVSEKKRFKDLKQKNIKFVTAENKYGWSSPLAYYYGATAAYFFYSHNSGALNRYRCPGQTVVNLWHGCGYKDAEQGKKGNTKQPDFDLALVPGELFVKTKSRLWNCSPQKLLTMGYPRYDWMKHPSLPKEKIMEKLFEWHGDKVILWMPTFRKSNLGGCAENEIELPYDLPAIKSAYELKQIDDLLRENGLLLVIKKHPLEIGTKRETQIFTNIRYISEKQLIAHNIQLYELIGSCDALISDYSSVAVDYLLMDRPLGYVLADYEIYKEKRGFVFEDPLEYMPGEKIYDVSDLKRFLKHISDGTDPYQKERKKMLLQMHDQTENYCQRLVQYFKL